MIAERTIPGETVDTSTLVAPQVPVPVAAPAKKSSRREKRENRDRLPDVGEYVIGERGVHYEFLQKLGDGAMGLVFLSKHEDVTVAVKTEKYSTSMLPTEVKVMKVANADGCKHFCQIYSYGAVKPEFTYVVMSLLGKDLYRLRSEQPSRQFSLNTVTKIALQTLEACEQLHNLGFISRDVKPSNFAPGVRENGGSKTIYMFDFGLAKRYRDRNNNVIPSRGEVGWRGTVRYGSLSAHKRMDLSRADDLESWFYMLVEFSAGLLPWRLITDRADTYTAKRRARTSGKPHFLRGCPAQFEEIMRVIDRWDFYAVPDYRKLRVLIKQIRAENNLSDRMPWDWQEEESEYSECTETLSYGITSDAAIKEEGVIETAEHHRN
ncbi:unnamed protein product [Caenorhabditis auriculariae]|uniref:Protein kinase domain-containing protein n=1 Tax=Caenorhabditis auriculariae TaxID=2777116 RepID=A0A8S1HMW5_9PELO|nr:unnamed protein product [Caenorhabditis auriculariae]